jgi:hypothetical protein
MPPAADAPEKAGGLPCQVIDAAFSRFTTAV